MAIRVEVVVPYFAVVGIVNVDSIVGPSPSAVSYGKAGYADVVGQDLHDGSGITSIYYSGIDVGPNKRYRLIDYYTFIVDSRRNVDCGAGFRFVYRLLN